MIDRQQENFKILEVLREFFEKNPDIRFGQGLYNLNIATHIIEGKSVIDIFFEEPNVTLKRIKS